MLGRTKRGLCSAMRTHLLLRATRKHARAHLLGRRCAAGYERYELSETGTVGMPRAGGGIVTGDDGTLDGRLRRRVGLREDKADISHVSTEGRAVSRNWCILTYCYSTGLKIPRQFGCRT